MLDESSCSTPSEDTGKYVCSFYRREGQAPGSASTRTVSLHPHNGSGVTPVCTGFTKA